ncbi:hypothetical protein ABZ816_02365 [Actinosynnema sp. NPDC047251]|nr:hypothetical protein [Saccharothrix espanaensis]
MSWYFGLDHGLVPHAAAGVLAITSATTLAVVALRRPRPTGRHARR